MEIPETLAALSVPIDSVRPYGRNPRRGNLDVIRSSLKAHGQYRPLVVNRRTGEVLAGNHTLAAARELGWQEIAATYVDVDDEQAARIVLIDNRANDLAGYDDQALADLIQSLPTLDDTGYDADDLRELLAGLGDDRGDPGRDTEPAEPPAKPVARPGDLWQLGRHRLLCGDATREADVGRAVQEPSELLWTDPPYGVKYVGKTARALTIQGDSPSGTAELLADALTAADAVLLPGARFYVAAPAGPQELTFLLAVAGVGWQIHQTLVWVKNTIVLGHSDYHYQHEPIIYGYKPGPGRIGRGNHKGTRWQGGHAASSVFLVDKPARSAEHPTMKPVSLVAQQLANSTRAGDGVLDPFAGSGSTVIACENLARVCYALELDPGYCDVIVDRWQRHTGGKAKRARC